MANQIGRDSPKFSFEKKNKWKVSYICTCACVMVLLRHRFKLILKTTSI